MSTIRDVARLAGVSISTVSLTLNTPERVATETRRKVAEAAEAVGYSADPIAQSLKRGRSRLIGMVVSDITNPFFGRFLQEIERHAMAADHLVIVSDTSSQIRNEIAILRHLAAQRVSGILLQPTGPMTGPSDHIRQLSMPFVLFDHRLDGVESDFVGADNALASSMLTEHLIRLGHRRIAFLGGTSGLYTAEERKRGFLATMAASGVPADPAIVVDARYDGRHGYEQTMRLMTGPDRPTALIAASNVIALGALQACNELGIACPAEVSLAGIDDVPWAAVVQPRITTAVQPIEDLARTASELLMRRITAPPGTVIDRSEIILAPEIRLGGSTARPA
ncbi:MAG: LacI family DNA-binding transcriptional regulator [Rubellimicrobium sp.]|nr:LacI family DNA-binding transcriptional regulator [Rubellimicrobium sp.]